MRLTVLGSGTGRPCPGRAPPGVYVEAGDARLLLDPGPGAVHRLGLAGGDPRMLDAVAVSHLHLDHCADLGPLCFALRNPAFRRTGTLVLAGGPGLTSHGERLRALHGEWVEPAGYTLRVVEGERWRLEVRGCAIQAGPVEHIPGAVGFRVMAPDGTVLAYSGDTTGDAGCVALAQGADCLLIECSAPDGAPVPKHTTPAAVARVAREARVRQVVLTHFYPEVDPAGAAAAVADATGIPTIAATDGMVLAIGARAASPA